MRPQISNTIIRLTKDLNSFRTFDIQKFGLSTGIVPFLIYIGDNEISSPSEMAKDLIMDPAHVARSIAKLSDLGLIEKIQTKYQDRRKKSFILTQEGRKAYLAAIDSTVRWEANILESLNADDKSILLSLFKKIENVKTV